MCHGNGVLGFVLDATSGEDPGLLRSTPPADLTQQVTDISSSHYPTDPSHHSNESEQHDTLNTTPNSMEATPEDPVVFDPLSSTVISELCGAWFKVYHPWFPILHQPSMREALETSPNIEYSSRYLVIKAIVAVTIHHCQSCPSTAEQRQQWSATLRNTVVMESMSQVSLQSVQALLILSNLDYGEGNTSRFWNLLALCKRMNTHLGLCELATNQGSNINHTSTVPPRMLPLPNTIIDREERVRAYWMTEVLDSMSTIGAGWNLGILSPTPNSVLPCSDSLWAFPEHIINVWSFGHFKYSSAFSLCIILVANEFWSVHNFLQKSFDMSISEERLQWQSEAQRIDERLTNWREEFVAAVFRLINAEFAQEERAEMDPNIVLTNCILNSAIIVLFQQRAPYPEEVECTVEPWAYATNRCVYACENIAAKVRRVHDDELLISNPHLILSIFIAARFYIVYAKTLNADVPSNLHSLAYALHICGKRWPLARRYETVIRTAVVEHRASVLMSSLPLQFYDLRYSTLNIDDALRVWVENLLPDLALGESAAVESA
ncbi:MAG: hypothetical protein M1834_001091 [Cirrosporium novae-zelandiae]|nr:MAG: hypothetical protein M1834_001091 [Cirrosporium novae-zelandiae]